jgi:hypothetical protein
MYITNHDLQPCSWACQWQEAPLLPSCHVILGISTAVGQLQTALPFCTPPCGSSVPGHATAADMCSVRGLRVLDDHMYYREAVVLRSIGRPVRISSNSLCVNDLEVPCRMMPCYGHVTGKHAQGGHTTLGFGVARFKNRRGL